MFFSVVITVYEGDQVFRPRALTGLLNQPFKDFQLIVVVDDETPLEYNPQAICGQTIPANVVYRPRSMTTGFRERHHGLSLAQGKYVAWLNVDNLVYPHWLQCHFENTLGTPGAVSVV